MRNDWPNTTAGAPSPVSVRWRSASSMSPRSSTMFDRISAVDAPELISPRISANFVSASEVSCGSDDAQRDLDVLEVTEVAGLGLVEGLVVSAVLDQRERAVDRLAHRVELPDRFVTRHRRALRDRAGAAAAAADAHMPSTNNVPERDERGTGARL